MSLLHPFICLFLAYPGRTGYVSFIYTLSINVVAILHVTLGTFGIVIIVVSESELFAISLCLISLLNAVSSNILMLYGPGGKVVSSIVFYNYNVLSLSIDNSRNADIHQVIR